MPKLKSIIIALLLFNIFPCTVLGKVSLPKGYLIFFSLETYEISKFGAISSTKEAEKIFSEINKYNYRDMGIAFLPIYYSKKDIEVHKDIAKIAQKYDIDLFASSYKLMERVRAFGNIKKEYQAYSMKEDGTIVPAYLENHALIDVLNKEAVDWFVNEYKKKYLMEMKGLIKGYIFDEDVLLYLDNARGNKNNLRYDYWNNPTYSDAVLEEWKRYCKAHDIKYNGKLVDKFPVHRAEMVKNGAGKTKYYPGFNVPEIIRPAQKFKELPKPEGVWKHWFDFISRLFISNWIEKIALAINEVNNDNPKWYGIIYVGFFSWTLSYENVDSEELTVPEIHKWGLWGRQRGMDLEILSKSQYIDYIICETYPPVKANLDGFIKEFRNIVDKNNKTFGLGLHRDDKWKLKIKEDNERWDLIYKYKPHLLIRYPLKSLLKESPYYYMEGEQYFLNYLLKYRQLISNQK